MLTRFLLFLTTYPYVDIFNPENGNKKLLTPPKPQDCQRSFWMTQWPMTNKRCFDINYLKDNVSKINLDHLLIILETVSSKTLQRGRLPSSVCQLENNQNKDCVAFHFFIFHFYYKFIVLACKITHLNFRIQPWKRYFKDFLI